jgi:hypothetical protein
MKIVYSVNGWRKKPLITKLGLFIFYIATFGIFGYAILNIFKPEILENNHIPSPFILILIAFLSISIGACFDKDREIKVKIDKH